jgi:hypothetical protein
MQLLNMPNVSNMSAISDNQASVGGGDDNHPQARLFMTLFRNMFQKQVVELMICIDSLPVQLIMAVSLFSCTDLLSSVSPESTNIPPAEESSI